MTPKLEDKVIDHITQILQNAGLSARVSRTIAREAALKAKKKLRPKDIRSALVTIEDSYRHDGRIRIFIKPESKKEAKDVLSSFLNGKKGYPDAEKFQVEEAFGLVTSAKIYHCTLKPKQVQDGRPTNRPMSPEEEVKYIASQMTKEDREALIKNLKKSISVE